MQPTSDIVIRNFVQSACGPEETDSFLISMPEPDGREVQQATPCSPSFFSEAEIQMHILEQREHPFWANVNSHSEGT